MEDLQTLLFAEFERAAQEIANALKQELMQQGHYATGKLAETIRYEITAQDVEGFEAVILANDYWVFLENGVSASRIPYTVGGPRRGGTSKYISALLDWAKVVRPELDEKERKGFVFAVAAKHKKEGMPTRGSYAFSKNGRRKGFASEVANNTIDKIVAKIERSGISEKIVSLLKISLQ